MRVYYLRRSWVWGGLAALSVAVVGLAAHLLAPAGVPAANPPTQAVYRGDPHRRAVGLTFNVDWGEEFIPEILQILAQNEAKATFFPTGRWAEKFSDLLREIAENGQEIGNHGYSHPHANLLGKRENQEEIRRAEQAIVEVTGTRPRLFAPPYGEVGEQVVAAAAELGYTTIMWTIDSVDWREGCRPEDIMARVRRDLQNGAIILLHPTGVTVQTLPQLLEYLRQEGYRAVTVSELL